VLHAWNTEGEAVNFLVNNIKWLMLVSGLLTCTMLYAAIAPAAALRTNFGDSLQGPLANVLVRSWGVLVFLMGAMLVYGAFRPAVRRFALVVAGTSKLAFVLLLLTLGSQFLGKAMLAVVFDTLWVLVFAAYLIATRQETYR
jgi:hypothetical protein